MTDFADERPDWADGRGQCPTCRQWHPITNAGPVRKHKRQEPGRWHMVPCDGGLPLPAREVPS